MAPRLPRLSDEERLLGKLDPAYARHRRIMRATVLVLVASIGAGVGLALSNLMNGAAAAAALAALALLILWRVGGKGDVRASMTHWAERRWESNKRAVARPKANRRSVGSQR